MPQDVIVGRGPVLAAAGGWLEEAAAGAFRLVIVRGPAGIGKTTVVRELLRRSAARGFRVLAAACHEDVAAGYLPIATALRSLAGAGALSDHMAATATAPDLADRERLALHLAVTDAVLDACRTGPVLLCLDDAHWATQPTLSLLEHVVSAAAIAGGWDRVPLAVVVAHRPVLGSHPALTRLAREPAARTLDLDGLGELDVNRLLVALAPCPPSRSLLAAVSDATGGNPLLVRVALDRLLRTGAAVAREGELVPVAPVGLPPDLGDLDGSLSALVAGVPPEGLRVLEAAAVLGDGGSTEELVAMSASDAGGEVLDGLATAGLLRIDGPTFGFGHPQLRTVVRHRLPPGRRSALHAAAADVIEPSAVADPGRAPALADHLARAGGLVERTRLARWSLAAADASLAIGAWADAARAYEAALHAGAPADPGLLNRAALAHFRNHDIPAARARASAALDGARNAGERAAWADAIALLLQIRMAHGAGGVGEKVDLSAVDAYLEADPEPEDARGAYLLFLLAEAQYVAFDFPAGLAAAAHGLDVAERLGDPGLLSQMEFVSGLLRLATLDLGVADGHLARSRELAQKEGDPWHEAFAVGRTALLRWVAGDPAGVEDAGGAAAALVGRHRDWAEYSLATACRGAAAALRGSFADAEQHCADAEAAWLRSDYSFTPLLLHPMRAWVRAARGDRRGAVAVLDQWEASGAKGSWRYRILVDAVTAPGALDATRLATAVERPPAGEPDLFTLSVLGAWVELADVHGGADPHRMEAAAEALESAYERGARYATGWPFSIARLAGLARLGAGDVVGAHRWLSRAASAADAVCPSEAARARLDLARVELRAGTDDGRARAAELLARAAATFDDLGMVPFLARCRRLAAGLPDRVPGTLATRYLLVTDLVDSTPMNLRAGDTRWLEVLREHNAVIRHRLRDHDGVEFKHTGDGICAWFSSGVAAVACASGLQADLDRANVAHPDLDLGVRAGVASGQPVGDEQDLFGVAVVLADRVCSVARRGEVVVTDEVAAAARAAGAVLHPLGPVALKGFPAPVPVHRLVSV